jgi:dCMP deaminase
MIRMSWDDYFLEMCKTISLRSIDEDTQVGAVIVNHDHRVVSTGYNAFPAGVDDTFWPSKRGDVVRVPHVEVERFGVPYSLRFDPTAVKRPCEVSELSENFRDNGRFYDIDKYMAMCHAEENAIVAAGQDLHGCTLYSLLFPCHQCAKLAITAGIKRVVYITTREDVSWAVAKELFIQAGVKLVGHQKRQPHDQD